MNDREKVVSEFERCIGSFSPADTSDEYFICVCKRVLELLKEQNKTIKSLTEEKERLLSERIMELQHNIDALHATMQDTMLVNNAIEQRRAVKWND